MRMIASGVSESRFEAPRGTFGTGYLSKWVDTIRSDPRGPLVTTTEFWAKVPFRGVGDFRGVSYLRMVQSCQKCYPSLRTIGNPAVYSTRAVLLVAECRSTPVGVVDGCRLSRLSQLRKAQAGDCGGTFESEREVDLTLGDIARASVPSIILDSFYSKEAHQRECRPPRHGKRGIIKEHHLKLESHQTHIVPQRLGPLAGQGFESEAKCNRANGVLNEQLLDSRSWRQSLRDLHRQPSQIGILVTTSRI